MGDPSKVQDNRRKLSHNGVRFRGYFAATMKNCNVIARLKKFILTHLPQIAHFIRLSKICLLPVGMVFNQTLHGSLQHLAKLQLVTVAQLLQYVFKTKCNSSYKVDG
jgi:hypothetical protein